jgi:hypothetical protein
MDLAKFYDTVVLRDILEYTLPGSIVVASAMLISDTILAQVGIHYSFFANLANIPLWQIFVLVAISYLMGHILTAFDSQFFRGDRGEEEKQTREVILKNEWLKGKLVKVFAINTETETADIEKLIMQQPSQVKTLREIARAIIHKNQQELYREFVNRHSIFSRLFKNVSIALTIFLISLVISSIIGWKFLHPLFSAHLFLSIFTSILLVGLISAMIWLLNSRSRRIRSTMIEHTFQILYADYIMSHGSKKKPSG